MNPPGPCSRGGSQLRLLSLHHRGHALSRRGCLHAAATLSGCASAASRRVLADRTDAQGPSVRQQQRMLGWGADPVARCGPPHGYTSQPDGFFLESCRLAGAAGETPAAARAGADHEQEAQRGGREGGHEPAGRQPASRGPTVGAGVPFWAQQMHTCRHHIQAPSCRGHLALNLQIVTATAADTLGMGD